MKIVAINGSPHRDGNTARLIQAIFQGAGAEQERELVQLVDLDLKYCNWCKHCMKVEPGVCPLDDAFPAHLQQLFAADAWIVATPSINHSVTGYMKNWLDRLCTSQLLFMVDDQKKVTMQSLVPSGKKAVVVVQGCTNQFQETLEPINCVLDCLAVPVVERLVVPHLGLTDEDTVDQRPEVLQAAYRAGQNLAVNLN